VSEIKPVAAKPSPAGKLAKQGDIERLFTETKKAFDKLDILAQQRW